MEKKKQTVCLITPGHLASDPRLVKEAAALSGAGYFVHIVCTQYVPYLIRHDEDLLSMHSEWTYNCLNWSRTHFRSQIRRFVSGFKISLIRYLPASFVRYRNEILLNRNFRWQCKKAIAVKASLYIAHNLGALPVAAFAAIKTNSAYAFDAEDFHRFESSNDIKQDDVKLKIHIEETYLPKAAYITAASPLIAERYHQISKKPVAVINNVFDYIGRHPDKVTSVEHLKLFWFSQTIGPNRGLETVIDALIKIREKNVELHLLGAISPEYKHTLTQKIALQNRHSLHFHTPVTQAALFEITGQFDIGLASEPGWSVNNDIALSNKLFTYLQCGLVVLLSDTSAQKNFFESHPGIGKIYVKNDADSLAETILFYLQNPAALDEVRKHNIQLARKTLNWNIEKDEFLAKVREVLPA